jgi:Response regulator containing CheY-like receiver domain and AraC-type DNA-binding domain
MEIAILGYRRELRNELEAQLRICLGDDTRYTPKQYGMDEPVYNRDPPEDTAAAFVIIDDARALNVAGAVANWGEDFPVVMAATGPQYALEGIRLKVKHYILYPLEQKDMREALVRTGVTE